MDRSLSPVGRRGIVARPAGPRAGFGQITRATTIAATLTGPGTRPMRQAILLRAFQAEFDLCPDGNKVGRLPL